MSRAWEALTPPLAEWILDAVSTMGFSRMTPVQASTIPLFSGHKDVVVEAVTGSGKTLAFILPVLQRLLNLPEPLKRHHVGAVIVSPTRELATQIHAVLLSLLAFHSPSSRALRQRQLQEGEMDDEEIDDQTSMDTPSALKIIPQLLVGGATSSPAEDLRVFTEISPNILIGTPGRLLELLSSSRVHCKQSSFEVLVMDEADRLLDLGFKDDLQKILRCLPKQRRTGLFSASVSEAVDQIVRVGLRNPVRISVKVKSTSGSLDKRTPSSLQMSYIVADPTKKLPTLAALLSRIQPTVQRSIVYVATCATVDYLRHLLPSVLQGFVVVPLHGKQTPEIRQKNFSHFVNSVEPSVLLTTDVAARGLDIPSVDLVVQLDPPSDPKTFLHRCGRAGRAGRKGLAVTLLTPGREEEYISFLAIRKTPISQLPGPPIVVTDAVAEKTSQDIKQLVLRDRAMHDKAQRAFVSWVQAYRKHAASSIFRLADLQWDELGRAWGLLRLPKMPELKNWTGDKSLGNVIEFDTYAYKDKQREKQRKENLREAQHTKDLPPARGLARPTADDGSAWSEKKQQKLVKNTRREKKEARRVQIRTGQMNLVQLQEQRELDEMIRKVRKKNQDVSNDAD